MQVSASPTNSSARDQGQILSKARLATTFQTSIKGYMHLGGPCRLSSGATGGLFIDLPAQVGMNLSFAACMIAKSYSAVSCVPPFLGVLVSSGIGRLPQFSSFDALALIALPLSALLCESKRAIRPRAPTCRRFRPGAAHFCDAS